MEPIGKFRLSKLFIVPHSWLLNYFDSRKKSIILVEKILSKEPMCRNISFEIIHAKNVLCYNKNRSKKLCVHFFNCRNFSVVIFPSFFCRKKSIENEKAPVEKIPSKFLRFACFLAVWLKTESFKNSEFSKTQTNFTKTQQKIYKNSDFRKIMSSSLDTVIKKTALNFYLITAHLLHITINFALN